MDESAEKIDKRELMKRKREKLAEFRKKELLRKKAYNDQKKIEKLQNKHMPDKKIASNEENNIEDIELHEAVLVKVRRDLQMQSKNSFVNELDHNDDFSNTNEDTFCEVSTTIINETSNSTHERESGDESKECKCNTDSVEYLENEVNKLSKALKAAKRREQKLRRQVNNLNSSIKIQYKRYNKMKRRYYRKCESNRDEIIERVQCIERKGPGEIRKRLIYHEALDQQLRMKKLSIKDRKSSLAFNQSLSGKVLKKYKVMGQMKHLVSMRSQARYANSTSFIDKISNAKKLSWKNSTFDCVRRFFEKDENSALAPGVKDTITKNNIAKRKRILLDTIDNLYKKFKNENLMNISRSTFYYAKPFWIVHAKITDRNTCLCKTHDNMKYLIRTLNSLKILNDNSSMTFLKTLVCNVYNRDCYYGQCEKCKDKSIRSTAGNNSTRYFKWQTEKISRLGSEGLTYNVNISSKKKIICSVDEFLREVNSSIPAYLEHVYITGHQYKALENVLNDLKQNEVYIVIDFSQNYICKYNNEIQSVHFGASQKQVSLHTGAFFYKNPLTGERICSSFCTLSECLRHDAAAIWDHLKPILATIKDKVPNLRALHFQSDGPSTQYKNKINFFLFQSYCAKSYLDHATWNFTSPGHGKSIADGIGGCVKGLCDRAAVHGNDVISAECMIDIIKSTPSQKVQAYLISESDIHNVDLNTKQPLKAVPNTTKIFQIVWSRNQENCIYLNHLTCSYCLSIGLYNQPCSHFSLCPNKWCFQEKTITSGQVNGSITKRLKVNSNFTRKNKDASKIVDKKTNRNNVAPYRKSDRKRAKKE